MVLLIKSRTMTPWSWYLYKNHKSSFKLRMVSWWKDSCKTLNPYSSARTTDICHKIHFTMDMQVIKVKLFQYWMYTRYSFHLLIQKFLSDHLVCARKFQEIILIYFYKQILVSLLWEPGVKLSQYLYLRKCPNIFSPLVLVEFTK